VALVIGQATLGTVATILFREPPGPGVVTLTSDTASTSTCYIGAQPGTATTAAVTSTNGIPLVPGGAISWATFDGKGPSVISGITTASSASTIGWVISSAG